MSAPGGETDPLTFSQGEKSILLRGLRKREKVEEVWFLIKPSSKGTVAKEIFQNLDIEGSNYNGDYFSLSETSCVQIGYSLYVLGGRDHKPGSLLSFSDTVRCLNIENPTGWKACKPLLHPCGMARVCAGGNLIYLFPMVGPDLPDDLPGGFIYDISNQKGKGYNMVPPSCYENDHKGLLWDPLTCFTYDFGDGCYGASITTGTQEEVVITYCPDTSKWHPHEKLQISKFPEPNAIHYAFLDGVLYISYWYWKGYQAPIISVLHAYDMLTGHPLFGDHGIALPEFSRLTTPDYVVMDLHFVAVANCKLCYLWSASKFGGGASTVFKVTAVVDRDHHLSVSLCEEMIELKTSTIVNCIPFDSYGETYMSPDPELLDEIIFSILKPVIENCNPSTELEQSEEDFSQKWETSLKDELRRLKEANQKLLKDNKKLVKELLGSGSNFKPRNRPAPYFLVGQLKVPANMNI